MGRHPPRYQFDFFDQALLMHSMAEARRRALKLGSALHMSAPRYRLCQDLHQAVDALAADLTGDPSFFHDKPRRG